MKLGGFQLYTSDLGGNPVRGNQEMLCLLTRPKVVSGLGLASLGSGRWRADQGARIRGSSAHMPGFLSPRHPPSTRALARSRHRDERQGQHSTRRTLMMPRNGIICERVRAPAEHAIRRRPVLRERAAGVRLRLRLRHRSCSTTGSFEAQLHETRGHHFRDSRCASRSRERTMACFFTSRLRVSPIP